MERHALGLGRAYTRNVEFVTDAFRERIGVRIRERAGGLAVEFRESDAYVASGEGLGKAGGYALQESGDRFVEHIDGSVSNVIGLPLKLVEKLLVGWEHEHRTKLLSKLTRGDKR